MSKICLWSRRDADAGSDFLCSGVCVLSGKTPKISTTITENQYPGVVLNINSASVIGNWDSLVVYLNIFQ